VWLEGVAIRRAADGGTEKRCRQWRPTRQQCQPECQRVCQRRTSVDDVHRDLLDITPSAKSVCGLPTRQRPKDRRVIQFVTTLIGLATLDGPSALMTATARWPSVSHRSCADGHQPRRSARRATMTARTHETNCLEPSWSRVYGRSHPIPNRMCWMTVCFLGSRSEWNFHVPRRSDLAYSPPTRNIAGRPNRDTIRALAADATSQQTSGRLRPRSSSLTSQVVRRFVRAEGKSHTHARGTWLRSHRQ